MTWTDERIARLKRLYADGMTYTAIAETLGLSTSAIGAKIRRLGLVQNEPQEAWPEEHVETLRRMHAAGVAYSAIGAAVGKSRSAAIGKAVRLGLIMGTPSVPKPVVGEQSQRAIDREDLVLLAHGDRGAFYAAARKLGISQDVAMRRYYDLMRDYEESEAA
jgi:hypothetical protein